jgi:hypothetical protein
MFEVFFTLKANAMPNKLGKSNKWIIRTLLLMTIKKVF